MSVATIGTFQPAVYNPAQTIIPTYTQGETMTVRAAVYARVSSDDRSREGRNLAGQLEDGRAYAAQRRYEVVAELAEDDRGASGAAWDLPELGRILSMAAAGEIDVLVVREMDRLSRDLAKQLLVERELERHGVAIEYTLAQYPATPEGDLMKHVRAVVAEYERLKITERMTRGRRQVAKGGSVMLHGKQPPYGYRVSEDGRQLVIHEPEAQVVRDVFTWYAVGDETGQKLGTRAIARRLTAMGLPTWSDIHRPGDPRKRRGYAQWAKGAIGWILRNESYIGKWFYGKQAPSGRNPRSHWIQVDVPAIIPHSLWDAAQAQKEWNKRRSRRNRRHDYLFSTRVICGACGSRMHGRSSHSRGKEYLYYACTAFEGRILGRRCDVPSFRADRVDALLWQWVRALLRDPESLAVAFSGEGLSDDEDRAGLGGRIESIDRQLADERSKVERLLDLYTENLFPMDMVDKRKRRVDRRIAALKRERDALVATLERRAAAKDRWAGIEAFASEVATGLDIADADFGTRRDIIETLDLSVTLALEGDERVAYIHGLPSAGVVSGVVGASGTTEGGSPAGTGMRPAGRTRNHRRDRERAAC